jgi:hypothetical protein
VKGALAVAVAPLRWQLTVCVPVPGRVLELVRYVQLTAPSAPAVSCTCRPAAVLVRPDGSRAVAEQIAPGVVCALT